MRPISNKLFFVLILACGFSTAAQAETPANQDNLDPAALAVVSEIHLEQAFERSMAKTGEQTLLRFGRPTSMLCQGGAVIGDAETCIVTAPSSVSGQVAVPAALAQR